MEVRAFGELDDSPFLRLGVRRFLVNAAGPSADSQTLSMDCEAPLEATQSDRDDQVFAWNQSIMSSKSNVKIGDVEYYHPFPSRKESSQCWNFFRCRLEVDYKSLQDVYCLRCCKKMKSKPGEKINYSFYTLKWQQGYSTSHLMKHIKKRHAADLMCDKESASEAQSPTQQRKITDSRVPGMSKTHRDALTKDLVQNLVFDLGYWRDNSTS